MKDIFWVEESSGKPSVCKKRKRRVGKRKIEFVGWGSRPLIEFLEAIGQDTREKHSQHEVAAFVTKYVNDKGLASAEKKKKVLCDERLYALFGKKSVSRIKVYDMLEEHFAENHDDSDDELLDSSDEEDYREKNSLGSNQMKKVPKTPKSCFAAVIPENIKLIYLKKSVVQELLKFPESFEFKIVGSFVRMKSDPNDIYQKNRFQLQLVTGVEKVSGAGDAGIEIHLRVSNFFKDVPLCMLSDDNFCENYKLLQFDFVRWACQSFRQVLELKNANVKLDEFETRYKQGTILEAKEVEDVRDRIKVGSLNKLTVNELQLKAQVLHADITKHWIAKEISLLQKLIDHANEKGWRRELFEYLERRKMLQTPSEQEKLLLKIPEVIAEELDLEGTVAAASEKAEVSACSPNSILRASSDVSSTDASGSGEIIAPSQVIFSDSHALKVRNGGIDVIVPVNDPKGDRPADIIEQGILVANVICDGSSREMQVDNSGEKDPQEKPEKPPSTTGVIDLSDDDSEDEGPKNEDGNAGETPDDVIWHYVDPQGQTRGPFSLYLLKRWSDANYFHSGFRVWKNGQTSDEGVLLVDVLRQTFPD